MFFLFAIASIPGLLLRLHRRQQLLHHDPGREAHSSTMVGVTVSIILAVTGVAANLIGFFTIVGASFGPICGAMAADYLLSGRKWAGPREGINWAGYGAWAIGFIVGILPFLPVSPESKPTRNPPVSTASSRASWCTPYSRKPASSHAPFHWMKLACARPSVGRSKAWASDSVTDRRRLPLSYVRCSLRARGVDYSWVGD